MDFGKDRKAMRSHLPHRQIALEINDVARLLRTLADQEVRQYGMTRAQWAVLARLERHEGLKQAELAEMLDLQPISLTRLIDRLADNGLIERRADPNDRRAKRLFLTPAAKPLMDRLDTLGDGLMRAALQDVSEADIAQLLGGLDAIKSNLRRALQARADTASTSELRSNSHV
jgi:MarR family transcriptional regulator for hemolysin